MQYNMLGDTGLIVSRLAFGAMTFGSAKGTVFEGISKVDQKLANELVARALDAGVNHFNTADVYTGGQSEEFLAKALGDRRKDVVISTKVAFRSGEALLHQGLSRSHILASIDGSLRRLNTDYIDVYLVHRHDPLTRPRSGFPLTEARTIVAWTLDREDYWIEHRKMIPASYYRT